MVSMPLNFSANLVLTAAMTLELPDREFGGYIFDYDGTLADTMPLHYWA